MILIMSLFGAVYLGIEYICSFVSNKLKILKARNRIYSLPVRKCTEADMNEACPICFDNYVIGVKLCVLKCHHEYHQFCLVKWSGETCPLCRDPLFSDKVTFRTPNYSTPNVPIPRSNGCTEGRISLINSESQEQLSIIIDEHAHPCQDTNNTTPEPNYSSSVEILNFTNKYQDAPIT
uniref:E3 ubiquitin-protein ligase RNF6 (Trinotate prediction) n=1 Tax=Myxobolus squamalis TaxID=59785 RepID=A0A6B2FWZ2_MYXSQ